MGRAREVVLRSSTKVPDGDPITFRIPASDNFPGLLEVALSPIDPATGRATGAAIVVCGDGDEAERVLLERVEGRCPH